MPSPPNTHPTIPPVASSNPVVLTPVPPVGVQLGDMTMPAFGDDGELLERPLRTLRLTLITVLGDFHVPLTEELAEQIVRALAKGLGLTVSERLAVVRDLSGLNR